MIINLRRHLFEETRKYTITHLRGHFLFLLGINAIYYDLVWKIPLLYSRKSQPWALGIFFAILTSNFAGRFKATPLHFSLLCWKLLLMIITQNLNTWNIIVNLHLHLDYNYVNNNIEAYIFSSLMSIFL